MYSTPHPLHKQKQPFLKSRFFSRCGRPCSVVDHHRTTVVVHQRIKNTVWYTEPLTITTPRVRA